ncbi:phage capsid protein, partial [Acinetobacter baumannii]
LGQTCQDIRTAIKTKYANAQVCPLIFFPSIRSPIQTLATYINYPSEHYSYPHFDYIMTEAYDWLLEAKLDLAHQAVS